MRIRGFRRLVALGLLLGLLAGACGNDDTESGSTTTADGNGGNGSETPAGDFDLDASFKLQTVVVPSSLDPHRTPNAAAIYYWNLLYDRLTTLDENLQPVPMLATEWEFSEENKVVEIQLRDDVVFHDGTPFDADVVIANFDRALNIEGSTVAVNLAGLVSYEAVSPTEVRLEFDHARPDFMALLAGGIGAMMSPAIFDDASIDLQNDAADAGSGPYLLEEWVPSERGVFTRAPGENWDTEAGKLARIEIEFVGDDRTRFSAIRAGETDAIYVQAANPNDIGEAQNLGQESGFEYVTSDTGVLSALLLQPGAAPFDDIRVRQAITHAIDADAIVDGFMRGLCVRTDQLVPEGKAGHISGFESPYPYDLDEARRLLDEAGLGGGFDLDIHVIQGRPEIPQIMQEQLSPLGINVEVVPLASVEVLTAWAQGQVPAWFYQANVAGHPLTTLNNTIGTGVATSVRTDDADLLAALDAAATLTGDEADEAYAELFQQVAEEAFWVPVCWLDAHYVVADDVVGFEDALLSVAQFAFDLRYVGRTS